MIHYVQAGDWVGLFDGKSLTGMANKISHARVVSVVWNGHVIQEDAEIGGPTRTSMPRSETARGPLMLQGDHGPVANRNVRLRELP